MDTIEQMPLEISDVGKVVSESFQLGIMTEIPKRVFGGLLHEMWKINTSTGTFAVKLLNSEIMRRDKARGNFVLSEKIANRAKDAGIPSIPAMKIGEEFLIPIGSKYVMLFPWVEGETLSEAPAGEKASHAIGRILAQIHSLQIKSDTPDIPYEEMNADLEYLEILEKEFSNISEIILLLQKKYNELVPALNKNMLISHRDIDQKNVLWNSNDDPIIIDWEASGSINPMAELVTMCLNWGGVVSGRVEKESFQAVLNGYSELYPIDYTQIYAGLYGYMGVIDWLMYNVKRSMDINSNTEEIRLAKKK